MNSPTVPEHGPRHCFPPPLVYTQQEAGPRGLHTSQHKHSIVGWGNPLFPSEGGGGGKFLAAIPMGPTQAAKPIKSTQCTGVCLSIQAHKSVEISRTREGNGCQAHMPPSDSKGWGGVEEACGSGQEGPHESEKALTRERGSGTRAVRVGGCWLHMLSPPPVLFFPPPIPQHNAYHLQQGGPG